MNWQLNYCRYNCTDNKGVVQPSCFRKALEGLNYTNPSVLSFFLFFLVATFFL
jgi:hypothetical protein